MSAIIYSTYAFAMEQVEPSQLQKPFLIQKAAHTSKVPTLKELVIGHLIGKYGCAYLRTLSKNNPPIVPHDIADFADHYIAKIRQEIEAIIGRIPFLLMHPPAAQPLSKLIPDLVGKKRCDKIRVIIEKYYAPRWPVLGMCARAGYEHAVKVLLDCGAPIDAQDYLGRTALMEAARNGKESIVIFLLARGANIFIQDKCKKNALELAYEKNQRGISYLLEQKLLEFPEAQVVFKRKK